MFVVVDHCSWLTNPVHLPASGLSCRHTISAFGACQHFGFQLPLTLDLVVPFLTKLPPAQRSRGRETRPCTRILAGFRSADRELANQTIFQKPIKKFGQETAASVSGASCMDVYGSLCCGGCTPGRQYGPPWCVLCHRPP
jgi:hypothetical protein